MKGNKSSGLPSGHRYPLGAGRTYGKVSEFDPKTGRGYISFKRNNNKYKVAFDARDVSGYRREAIRVGLKVTFLTEQRETRSRVKDVIVTVPPPRSKRRLVRSNPHPDEVDEADAAARPVEVVNGGERVQTEDAAAQARRSFDMYVARALLGGKLRLSEATERGGYVLPEEMLPWPGSRPETPAEMTPVIEKIRKLTPELIAHLKRHEDDLRRIDPLVFEHLVAEFLASQGFSDVRLMGVNPNTGADIYAARVDDILGIEHRYFIEVKRRQDKVGVELIDRVYGAFLAERAQMGWHAAIIVSISGFKDIKKYTPYQLKLMGIELKDRNQLLQWLRGYKQRADGLWLPVPHAS